MVLQITGGKAERKEPMKEKMTCCMQQRPSKVFVDYFFSHYEANKDRIGR